MRVQKSNFSFMINSEAYEKSDVYRRICENARLAEGSYFINSDIFNFYVRKAVELSCKYIEISDKLNIYTNQNSSKKTIGTYLLKENCFEFIPAIGGISNYNLVKKIHEGVNPSAHDNYTAERNKIESYEIIVAFYELMVWLYRKCGGKQQILTTDFDEKFIPYETDISFFFKDKDLNMDISERDKRYIESVRKREEGKVHVVREGDKILVMEQDTGRKQYYLLEDFHNEEIANEQKLVNRYKAEITNLNVKLEKLKKENGEKEQLWLDEKKRILNEVAEIEKNFEQMNEDDKKIISCLKEQLYSEEIKHNKLAKEYEEHFLHFQTEIALLKHQCEIYQEQSGQLEEIIIAYEQLKAEYSAIKYQIDTQKQHLIIPASVNQIVLENQFQGVERLRIYLLRLKVYYDEKERRYNEEIERIRQERDKFKRKYEEKLDEKVPIMLSKHQYTKQKKALFCCMVASACVAIAILIFNDWGASDKIFRKDIFENTNNSYVDNTEYRITEESMEDMNGISGEEIVNGSKYEDAVIEDDRKSIDKSDSTLLSESVAETGQDTTNYNVEEYDDTMSSEDIIEAVQDDSDNNTEMYDATVQTEAITETEHNNHDKTEENNSIYGISDQILDELKEQQVIIPQNLESVEGINQQLLSEIEGLDMKSISVFGKKTKRDDMYYIGEAIVPGMTKNGYSMLFMGPESKRHLCNMLDNKIIKFAYMSGNGMGCVMIAVDVSDLSNKLSRESTVEDAIKVLGDDTIYHEMDVPTTFSASETEKAILFEFERTDGVIIMFGEDGSICDYAYIGIQ